MDSISVMVCQSSSGFLYKHTVYHLTLAILDLTIGVVHTLPESKPIALCDVNQDYNDVTNVVNDWLAMLDVTAKLIHFF